MLGHKGLGFRLYKAWLGHFQKKENPISLTEVPTELQTKKDPSCLETLGGLASGVCPDRSCWASTSPKGVVPGFSVAPTLTPQVWT